MSQFIDGKEVFPFGKHEHVPWTHKELSFLKSAIRLCGYFLGALAFKHTNSLAVAVFWILLIAEVIGIIEELDPEVK